MTRIDDFKKFVGPKVWRYFLWSIFLGIGWFAVESSFILVLQGFLQSINLLTNEKNFLPDWYPTSLVSSVIILIVFGCFRAVIFTLKNYVATYAQVAFTCEQRKRLLRYGLENASLVSSREIISLFSEITHQSGIVIYYIAQILNISLSIFLFFIIGFKLAPGEMSVGIVLLGIALYPLRLTSTKIKSYGVGIIDEWDSLNHILLLGLKNNFLLKIYNTVKEETASGLSKLDRYEKHYTNYSLVTGFSGALPMFIGVIILSVITYFSVSTFHTGPIKLVAFFYIFIRLCQSSSDFVNSSSSLKFHYQGFRLLKEWNYSFDAIDLNKGNDLKLTLRKELSTIVISKLSYHYPGTDKKLFSNINLTVKPGDVLIVKGESGAGKSTLLALILGLLKPTEGSVKVNTFNTKLYDLDLSLILGYVGPEAYLIQGSLRQNLLYGHQSPLDVTDEDLRQVLERVELLDLLNELPNGFDEVLKEVSQISTGQKQRISFGRALLRSPSLLILDEATANLDLETEKRIIEKLKLIKNDCTMIIVTHKDTFDSLGSLQIKL